MRVRIFTVFVLFFCSFAVAQHSGTENAIPQECKTNPPAQQTVTDFQPDTIGACSSTFTSGSDNTYLAYCVQPDGNIIYITTPAGRIMNSVDKGYGLCDATAPNTYFDFGDRFGASGNWDAPVQNSKTGTAVKITRTTSDGIWTLTQAITQVASTSSIKVAMTLTIAPSQGPPTLPVTSTRLQMEFCLTTSMEPKTPRLRGIRSVRERTHLA